MRYAAVTRILLKTFVAGFYKAHAGLLLTLFITIFINFFFTQVLNQTHLDKEQILLNNLKLVLTSVSNPVAMGVLFLIWLGYTIKSCQFVSAQLVLDQNLFLFYSSTALSIKKQFQTWFLVQACISIPIIALGFFAVGIGIVFNYLLIPIAIPVYLLLLISGSALYYIHLINNLIESKGKSYVLNWITGFPKPLFSLFLYEIIYKYKIHYTVTKVISAILIIGMHALFRENPTDIRVAGVSMLSVCLAHTFLIYQSHEFDRSYLSFSRNFPSSKNGLYMQLAAQYFLLLLPEIIWFFCIENPAICLNTALLGLSCTLLFRSILYGQNQQMGQYIKMVFRIFILSALLILFGAFLWLIAVNMIISFFIFNRNYQKSLD
jgi:hypothetical protein